MNKETLRMQMLAGVITEGQYKDQLNEIENEVGYGEDLQVGDRVTEEIRMDQPGRSNMKRMTSKEKRHLMMAVNKYMYDNNMSSTQWLLNGDNIEFYKLDSDVKYLEVKLNDILNHYNN